MKTKTCTKCKTEKALSEFRKSQGYRNGICAFCKQCEKEGIADWRKRNSEKYKNYQKEWWSKHKKWSAKKQRERYSTDSSICKVHNQTRKAISVGLIKKLLCEICGSKAEAHHDDYNFSLSVRWLCRNHHSEWHKNNKPIYKIK